MKPLPVPWIASVVNVTVAIRFPSVISDAPVLLQTLLRKVVTPLYTSTTSLHRELQEQGKCWHIYMRRKAGEKGSNGCFVTERGSEVLRNLELCLADVGRVDVRFDNVKEMSSAEVKSMLNDCA